MKNLKSIRLAISILSLSLILTMIGCTEQDECNCTMYTYEHWDDGSLEHWKPYSQIQIDCTDEISETTVETLENGHELKVYVGCE
tara:strand:+ start:345 stop:599 length:255 start_codon:yes stop_codon:yes gene_type:complete